MRLVAPLVALLLLTTPTVQAADTPSAPRPAPFAVRVVDRQTDRGVPLVELRTVSGVRLYTDSAGYVAVDDPALIGRRVFLTISSHGYQYPADGIGFRGTALELTPGGSATLKIDRVNLAERLYRTTGEGVYAESVKLGLKPPTAEPLLNAKVTGQDSCQSVVYRGRAYFFWGDTNRQAYPLGHFGMAGATSELPGAGGLSPDVGVNLRYFVDADGFSRGTFDREGNALFWADGAFVVKDAVGREHLLATVSLMKSLTECVGRRLVEFDDARSFFQTIKEFPADGRARPHGHAVVADVGGKPFVHFGDPLPDVRVPATYEAATDLANYEAFTCLTPGELAPAGKATVDRDESGKPKWGWKKHAARVSRDDVDALIKSGKLRPDESRQRAVNVATGEPVVLHAGSVNWNAYRKRFVMIAHEFGGKPSVLGEVYYLEAEALEGPWARAVKIVTHDRYSFYNPVHHAFFDVDGGRTIYFEGTYSAVFSRAADDGTPRYDYNQIMYKLDLGGRAAEGGAVRTACGRRTRRLRPSQLDLPSPSPLRSGTQLDRGGPSRHTGDLNVRLRPAGVKPRIS